jgi:hypothetical protein
MKADAVCHVHSDWSYDGRWPLKDLSREFSRRGNRILLMTEHDRGFTSARFDAFRAACTDASTEEILVVPGIEYSDSANRIHVLVWGTPFLGEGLPTGEMLQAVEQAGGVAVLAHPSRKNAWREFHPEWGHYLAGIEGWNRKYDGWAPGMDAPKMLHSDNAICFVGLDFHTEKQFFPLTMVFDIPADVTEEKVLDCIRSRQCAPKAFGLPLDHHLLRRSIRPLRVAEKGRRKLASIVKHSRLQTRSS